MPLVLQSLEQRAVIVRMDDGGANIWPPEIDANEQFFDTFTAHFSQLKKLEDEKHWLGFNWQDGDTFMEVTIIDFDNDGIFERVTLPIPMEY